MQLDAVKISQAVEKHKIAIICATCTKYWQARDRGLPEPQCLSISNCASPIGGGNFHEYEGPIPDFKIWCFVCGGFCTKFIFVKGKERIFGICDTHLEEAKGLAPVNIDDPADLERYYIDTDGKVKPLNVCAQPFKKQSFKDFFNEVEGYHTRKNGGIYIDV